jgi:large subunit ribosomal protein L6
MSKIGRRPIFLGNTQVEVKGNEIYYKGKKESGIYSLPKELSAQLSDKELVIMPVQENSEDIQRIWGLHRALIANRIKGADTGFEKQLRIQGLGFKAALSGQKLQFSLGFSHKIDFVVPQNVSIEVDKTGQIMTLRSSDRDLLGQVCSDIRALRPAARDPYKVTGILYADEVVRRKAGKAKS